jgi:uncharacterized OB-fold protein
MEGSGKGEKKQVFYPGEEHWVLEKGDLRLVGGQCKKCKQNYFPSKEICPKCFAEGEMEKIKLSSRGRLYSYSIVQIAPKRCMPPYAVGYVDFPEGVRVLGQLTTTDPEKLNLDMEVQTELGRIAVDEEGSDVFSYRFKPV